MAFFFDYEKGCCNAISIKLEEFQELITKYYIYSDLYSDLVTVELKRTYLDAKQILANNAISKELKMGVMRPLIEAFVNERSNVNENDDIRVAIKSLNDKGLKNALHKIVSDTLPGMHVKQIEIKNNSEEILTFLETLFTKIYKIPKEVAELNKEISSKKDLIEAAFLERLKLIKK